MSPDAGDHSGASPGVAETHARPSRAELVLDFVKAARLPIIVGLVCFAGLGALLFAGVPWRSLTLAFLTAFLVAPYLSVYSVMFAWWHRLREGEVVVVRDDDHTVLGIKILAPGEWSDTEIDGELTERRGLFTNRTVHVSEGHRFDEREERRDDGEIVTVEQRVLEGTWELELSYQEFVEDHTNLKLWKERIVPLARAGQKERAGRDVRLLETTDRVAHGLIAGAEKDTFIDDDVDPFGFDPLNEDTPDFLAYQDPTGSSGDDSPDDRPGEPLHDAGEFPTPRADADSGADVAADGGEQDG
jgi:hypothetical protein